jgi:hypothetical protein
MPISTPVPLELRIGIIVAVLTLMAISAVNAIASSRSRQAVSCHRSIGSGVSLSIDNVHREPIGDADSPIELQVTLNNYGDAPLKIDYATFSLSGAAGERSVALLPAELHGQAAPPFLMSRYILAKGETLIAVLYFRSPSRPIDLRIDLTTPDGRAASRSFLPLALN